MQVSFERNKFVCRDAFAFKGELYKNGFHFDGKSKLWESSSVTGAMKFREYFDDKASKIAEEISIEKIFYPFKWRNISDQERVEKLDEVQKEGIDFATAIMTDFVFRFTNANGAPSLFIVPPNLISNWVDEFKMWRPHAEVVTLSSIDDISKLSSVKHESIILCADSLFLKDRVFDFKIVSDVLKSMKFLTIVVDEAHRFINLEAERTKEVLGHPRDIGSGIVHRAEKVILLSGTHMRRGPINLYAPIFSLAWNLINYANYASYGVRYCNGHERQIGHRRIWDFNGSSREDELHEKLYGKFILQKTLEESRPELIGKKIERVVTLDFKKSKTITSLETAILKKKKLSDIVGSDKIGAIAEYRSALAPVKVKACFDYISDQLEDTDNPCVIFAMHHKTIDLLMAAFKKYRPKEISGRVKMKDRVKIEKEFQSGKLKLIIWQVQTAYGRNAQKGNRCFFVESPWSPDEIDQAINRFYRRGQKNIVVADHLVLADTLDQYVLKTCINKKEITNNVKKGVSVL
jgi:SNF2 family DNA or RNA helicase